MPTQPGGRRKNLAGERWLITHTLVRNIMGSTVVVRDLAEYLTTHGAELTVYAGHAGPPAADWFADLGVPLVTDEEADLRLEDFDVVWVHSQVLPLAFLRQLASPPEQMPTFIFNHMSAVEWAPDEFPFIHGLEERLSSLSLFVAPNTLAKQQTMFTDPPRVAVFPNPVPAAYAALTREVPPSARRILIASNHRPPEIEQAKAILRRRGYEVLHLGAGHDRYELLTPELLARFDVVISIGRTVYCCLVSGTPVFVYDHFGGHGYLTPDNVDEVAYRNFSGRYGQRLSGEEIADGVLQGYRAAVDYQREQRASFVEKYTLDHALPHVLAQARKRPIVAWDSSYVQVNLAMQRFANRYYRAWGDLDRLTAERSALEQDNRQLRSIIAGITDSRSFRLGYSLMRPFIALREKTVR